MRGIEEVNRGNLAEFLAYCRKHRFDHDESFLSEHDLAAFDPEGHEDFALIYRDSSGLVRGAAALMLRPDLRAAGKARFRILHVEAGLGEPTLGAAYRDLVDGLSGRAEGLDWIYLFLPEKSERLGSLLSELGFSVERYAWLLERDLSRLPSPELPPGCSFREAQLRGPGGVPGDDAVLWCAIVNAAFHDRMGHTELLPDRLLSESDPALDFPGSWLFLEDRGRAIGLCATVRDIEEGEAGAFLGPVAILPAYRGRGLGRATLRAGLGKAKAAGFRHCCLSVNAENANAVRLYLGEDFRKKYVMVCWHRPPCPHPDPA